MSSSTSNNKKKFINKKDINSYPNNNKSFLKKKRKFNELNNVSDSNKNKNKNQIQSKNNSENKDSTEYSLHKKDNILENNLVFNEVDVNKRIFIGNLNYKCKEDELEKFFADCGKILKVEIKRNSNGESKGNGFIDFKFKKAKKKALEKNGNIFKGRKIVVDNFIKTNKICLNI